jgi:hypothetical protein
MEGIHGSYSVRPERLRIEYRRNSSQVTQGKVVIFAGVALEVLAKREEAMRRDAGQKRRQERCFLNNARQRDRTQARKTRVTEELAPTEGTEKRG